MISIVFITLFAQTTFAEALTPQEADLLIKEDVAATQVLAEVCPALTGNNPLLKTKIDALTQKLLKIIVFQTSIYQRQNIDYSQDMFYLKWSIVFNL